MLLKFLFLSFLIITVCTILLNSIVNKLHMLSKSLFQSCLIVTVHTTIFNSIVNRLHMLLKSLFLSCLIVTLHTTIFNSIVNILHMLLKVLFPSCLITTLRTTILNSNMNRFHMYAKTYFPGCLIVTMLTNIFILTQPYFNTYGPRRCGHGREPKKYGPRMGIWIAQRAVWFRGERSDPRNQTALWAIQIPIRGTYFLCSSRPLGRDGTKWSTGRGASQDPCVLGDLPCPHRRGPYGLYIPSWFNRSIWYIFILFTVFAQAKNNPAVEAKT